MYIWSSYVPRNKSVVGYSVGEVQACVEGGRMVQVSIECDDEDDTRDCDESSDDGGRLDRSNQGLLFELSGDGHGDTASSPSMIPWMRSTTA
jgi:hypothetical protein